MSMIKICGPAGWDFGEPTAAMVKVSSDGRLRENDRRQFVKRAAGSENVFLPYLDLVKFAKDEVPIHAIALGAYEKWGFNRNGDGFLERVLRKYHDTFVKFARQFRNHKNKDPKISFGTIKLSAYNPHMHRVELLIGLNGSEEAARRNGGLLADRELEKLAKGEDLPGSMACRVPNDRCSYCGNVASTREEYCKAATCQAGGCYDNLTKLVKVAGDIHHVGVFNDHPCFFDYSHVFRPADPTAYGGKADWVKAAADGFFGPGGVKAAEDLGLAAPWEVILYQDREADGLYDPRLAAQVKLAHALAIVEQNPGLLPHPETRRAFTAGVQPPVDLDALDAGEDREKTAAALAALADRKIVLPLRDFARLAKRAELADAAAPFAAGAISRMVGDGTLESRLRRNPYAPSEKTASARQRSAAARLVSSHSLEPEAVRDRCLRSAARGQAAPDRKDVFQKWASQDRPAEELARDYACYKIAALQRIAEFDANFALTAGFACCQNQVVRDVA